MRYSLLLIASVLVLVNLQGAVSICTDEKAPRVASLQDIPQREGSVEVHGDGEMSGGSLHGERRMEVGHLHGGIENGEGSLYDGRVLYDDVAVIVNDRSDISREIATYFIERRGVPPENVINISTSTGETINNDEFDRIAAVIKGNLTGRGIADRINYFVTTKGVPLRVSGAANARASFDSELMLIGGDNEGAIHQNGWIVNPYYRETNPFSFERYDMRLTTRLTGYTVEEAKSLVDKAEGSYGNRGLAFLDVDPNRDGSSGYKIANDWMRNAHQWLQTNGHPSYLDENRTFRTGFSDLMAYCSWGSNDGNWNYNYMPNSGFESGTGEVPSSWTLWEDGGNATRNETAAYSGTYGLLVERNTSGRLGAYLELDMPHPDHRYIVECRVRYDGVTAPGARMVYSALDDMGSVITSYELFNVTGTHEYRTYQEVLENSTEASKIRVELELLGEGTASFDSLVLKAIRPHNTWVDGAIAETCVSTGGRSFTYGTWYGQSLVADLIRDGVTGVKGYVYEPYLTAISHADILFPAYYSGFNLAESYWAGSALASWMGTVVGDPKCAPFMDLRPDLGFDPVKGPLSGWVDENGTSHISINLHNHGKAPLVQGLVELIIDGGPALEYRLDLDNGTGHNITRSYSGVDDGGVHTVEVLLNRDLSFRDGNGSNDHFSGVFEVNTVPRAILSILPEKLNRTETLSVEVGILDPDETMDTDRLDVLALGPESAEYRMSFASASGSGFPEEAHYSWTIPPDAPVGYYGVAVEYMDLNGSVASMRSEDPVLVLNNIPVLNVSLSSVSIRRGEGFNITVEASDLDSDPASLSVSVSVRPERDPGELEPVDIEAGPPVVYRYEVPPQMGSQRIDVEVKLTDPDRAVVEWKGHVNTTNGAPSGRVLGGPVEITRLETAVLRAVYEDPEGQTADRAKAVLMGPKGSESEGEALSFELEGSPGVEEEMVVEGAQLAVGEYDLVFSFMDDEGLSDEVLLSSAVTVTNLPPEPGEYFMEVEGEISGMGTQVIRGEDVHISFQVLDEDSPYLTGAEGTLYGPNGDIYIDRVPLRTSKEWQFGFRFDIRTSMDLGFDWEVGNYTVEVAFSDDVGDPGRLVLEDAFELVTMPPYVDEQFVEYADGTLEVTVMVAKGEGDCLPRAVHARFLDGNGSHFSIQLENDQGGLIEMLDVSTWSGVVGAQFIPKVLEVTVEDEEGRSGVFDFTLNITVTPEEEEGNVEGPAEGGTDTLTLMAAILVITAILVILFLVALVIVVQGRRANAVPHMMAAPPMPRSLSGGESPQRLGTGEGDKGALPPSGKGPTLPPAGSSSEGGQKEDIEQTKESGTGENAAKETPPGAGPPGKRSFEGGPREAIPPQQEPPEEPNSDKEEASTLSRQGPPEDPNSDKEGGDAVMPQQEPPEDPNPNEEGEDAMMSRQEPPEDPNSDKEGEDATMSRQEPPEISTSEGLPRDEEMVEQ